MTMHEHTRCGLGRRLLAILYDSLVVLALLIIATVPVVLITGGAQEESAVFRAALQVYVLVIGFAFFGGFWHFGGQTIGMRAWHIRVTDLEGDPVSWRAAGIRYIVALFSWAVLGLGFLWSLIDPDQRTWHDIVSETRLSHERPRGDH